MSKPDQVEEPKAEWLQEINKITSKTPPVNKTDEELRTEYYNYLEEKYK